MSTELLHYGANERKHLMLEKLGGKDALTKATDLFYDRQNHDEQLAKFFHGTDLAILKWHQFNLMGIAFTEVPRNFDIRHLILVRHKKLFDQGLDETYFDLVMEHFSSTLRDMNVDPSLIDDASQVVLPLRNIFIQGAKEARDRKLAETHHKFGSLVVLVGIIAFFAIHTARQKK